MCVSIVKNRGCSLLGYEQYPSIAAHHDRYLRCGYEQHIGADMNALYRCYMPAVERQRIERLELFDEFEEWHLINAHYHISQAYRAAATQQSSTTAATVGTTTTTGPASPQQSQSDSNSAVVSAIAFSSIGLFSVAEQLSSGSKPFNPLLIDRFPPTPAASGPANTVNPARSRLQPRAIPMLPAFGSQ